MFKTKLALRVSIRILTIALAPVAVSIAHAQCNNPQLAGAFVSGLGRQPTATECNATRYAGGSWTSPTDLIYLVRASQVCSDPWIAQAYYRLGRKINNHDATQMENGRPGSTMDQCNYTMYGSWSSFPQLVQLVSARSATPAPIAPAPPPVTTALSAQIMGPASLISSQVATLTWSYTGTPSSCGSGVNVEMNGSGISHYGIARIMNLATRSLQIQMGDWSKSLRPGDTPVTLTLIDLCSGRTISPVYSTKITVPGAPVRTYPAPQPPTAPAQVTVHSFHLISGMGSRCLGVDGSGGAMRPAGTKLIHWSCIDQIDQYFTFMPNGQIAAYGGQGGMCVDDKGGMAKPGDDVVIWPCAQSTSRWDFVNGRISMRGQSNKCIDLWGSLSGAFNIPTGAQIQACNGGENQRWVGAISLLRGNSVNPIPPDTRTPIHGLTAALSDVNGSSVIAAGGGNVIAAGGGNVIAAGGGNVIAAGGGNVIAAGGGNLYDKAGNLLSTNGGNVVGPAAGSIVFVPITNGVIAAGGGN